MPTSKKQMAARVPAAIEFTHKNLGRRFMNAATTNLIS